MTDTMPNMEAAYKNLRPVMFGALGKLAHQGFVVSPADAVDLIHDFFVEQWQHIVDNYDPQKGRFETYSYVSFVHFARPRIVRLQRLQKCLVPPEDIEMLPSRDDAEADFAAALDGKVVRQAISRLPQHQRDVLTSYIYSRTPSERLLATTFNVSRYRLRETLVDALGRVLVFLDRPERMPEQDWKVALALWRDRRTIAEAASYLGGTAHQIRQANSRNMKMIAEALRSYEPHKGPRIVRRTTMEPAIAKSGRLTPQHLFEQALRSNGNGDLLQQVSARAKEVLVILEDPESIALSEHEIEQLDPGWIAQVYEALSKASSEWEGAVVRTPEVFYAHADEEQEVGAAFKEALIADLPDNLRDPHQWLGPTVPRVDQDEREYALKSPSAVGAMLSISPKERSTSEAASLADYGVTPLMVFRSTQAISLLLDRFLRKGKLDPSVRISLPLQTVSTSDSFDPEILVDEIKRMAECRRITAGALYSWDIQVAQYKPCLFDRFHAEPNEEGISLRRVQGRHENLFERWRFSEVAVPA